MYAVKTEGEEGVKQLRAMKIERKTKQHSTAEEK